MRRSPSKTKMAGAEQPEQSDRRACCSAVDVRAPCADVMKKHDHVWIMSDDMDEHPVFDGFQAC